MIFLQAYWEIAHKILDLDDNRAPNIAELEKKFHIRVGFVLHITTTSFMIELLVTRALQIKLCLSLQTHYFLRHEFAIASYAKTHFSVLSKAI